MVIKENMIDNEGVKLLQKRKKITIQYDLGQSDFLKAIGGGSFAQNRLLSLFWRVFNAEHVGVFGFT